VHEICIHIVVISWMAKLNECEHDWTCAGNSPVNSVSVEKDVQLLVLYCKEGSPGIDERVGLVQMGSI
jgi:hypothetical protein